MKKMRRRWLFSLAVAFILLQCWTIYYTIRNPYLGISISKTNDQVVVEYVEEGSGGEKLGILPGDNILSINGSDPEKYPSIQKFATVDQADVLLISRNHDQIQYETKVLPTYFIYDYFYAIAESMNLLLVIFVLRKIKPTPSSYWLSAILTTVAIVFMSMSSSIRGDSLSKYLISGGMLIVPLLLIHFICAFMKEKGHIQIRVRFLKPAWTLVFILLGITLSYFVNVPMTHFIYTFSKKAVLIGTVIGILCNAFLLIHLYFQHRIKNKSIVLIIKSISLALICAIAPLLLLSLVPRLLFGHAWIDSVHTSYFLFILPITFVYLLATRRLYDVDQIVRRILFIAAIALIPSFLLTAAGKVLFIYGAKEENQVLFFFLLWVSLFFLLYTLEYLVTRMESFLFPRNFNLKKVLKKIAKDLGNTSTMQELKDHILHDIVETLEAEGAAIVFTNKDTDALNIIVSGEINEQQIRQALIHSHELSAPYSCFEITRHEENSSYLIVTAKKSGAMLGQDDLNWLRLVLSYLAVAMENVQLIRKLDDKIQHLSSLVPTEEEADQLLWFRKLLVDYQEQERVRLAMDLHDTTMQDLFMLKRGLQGVTEKDDTELEQYVRELSNSIDRINQNLRQSCFELHPHLLREIGLVATINKLFQVERKLNDFQIHFISVGDSEVEEQDIELKRNVFRMVQELLNNAKKYAGASHVRFSLILEDGNLYLEYMDDGIGFDPDKPVVREIGSNGMGIRQMKTRIMAMGGSCQMNSKVGEGVHFVAQFPLKHNHKGKSLQ